MTEIDKNQFALFDLTDLYHCSFDVINIKLHFSIKERPKLSDTKSVGNVDVISVYYLVVTICVSRENT